MDVVVPRHPPPRFPDRCVVCGVNRPAHTAELLGAASNSALDQQLSGWGRNPLVAGSRIDSYSVDIPVCGRCWLALHARRFTRPVTWWVLCGVGVLGLTGVLTPTVSITSAGVLGLVLAISFVVEVRHPARFDVRADGEWATFTFRDLTLGYEFRVLNPSHSPGGLTSA